MKLSDKAESGTDEVAGDCGKYSFDTGPPSGPLLLPPKGLRRIKSTIREWLSPRILKLLQRAAGAHIGGETVDDALIVARRFANANIASTLGFWDSADYTVRQVADIYLASIERVAASGMDSYLSIKPPALRFDHGLAVELATSAEARNVRLHCDSHGPEVVPPSRSLIETMLKRLSAKNLGTTLPGRWARSLYDADWAIEHGIGVRVVKGQWPGPADSDRDMRQGFLDLIDRLAGRARHVAVATHDLPLIIEAINRLSVPGTSCEIELLFNLLTTQALRWGSENDVRLRIYVPFGRGYLPDAIGVLRRNPRLAWRVVRNILSAARKPR